MNNINNYKINKIYTSHKNLESEYPIFINFFTDDNGYEQYVCKLIDSLEKFKLPYYIVSINSQGHKWEKICQLKPYLIQNIFKMYPNKNIVWIDADAIIEKKPILFTKINKSVAAHIIAATKTLCSGTVYFKNNSISKQILKDWILLNNKNENAWDQKTLQQIIIKFYKKELFILPKEYCSIFDREGYINLDRVISHWQASRKLKFSNRLSK